MKNARRFLENGDKVKVTMRFRGREMAHQDIGMAVLERMKKELEELSKVELQPKLEGRQMIMILASAAAVPATTSAPASTSAEDNPATDS